MNPQGLYQEFPASAEYLSEMYLIQRDYGRITNTRLAQWLQVSSSAISQAVGRLKKLGVATQKRYGDIELTEAGQQLAAEILKRHYLIEHLLVQHLGYPWHLADAEAKVLQSQISQDLADHLYERLGRPQTCPHGNPMPGAAISQKLLSAPRLVTGQARQPALILRITEEGEGIPDLLAFCQRHGISPGRRFLIVSSGPSGIGLTRLTAKTRRDSPAEFEVSPRFAQHICFEPESLPE